MTEYERIENCPCMRLDKNKIICIKAEGYDKKVACHLYIIGFDENGF